MCYMRSGDWGKPKYGTCHYCTEEACIKVANDMHDRSDDMIPMCSVHLNITMLNLEMMGFVEEV